jgi:uncharacterized membrane protein (DUF4010 family)
MVALIVAISLGGYIAYKMLGQKAGTLLGGILGGMISSTATTVSYARRTRNAPEAQNLAIIAILIASGIAYGRVILEISIIASGHVYRLIPPMTAMLVWMFVISAGAYLLFRPGREEIPQPSNPAELKSAIIFGLIYAAVLLAVAAVRQHFGNTALYAVAVVSGLTDMDAITLSIARMVQSNRLDPGEGWRLVLVASLTNLVFKWGAAAFLGGWRFGLRLGIFFGIAIAGGMVLLWLWP